MPLTTAVQLPTIKVAVDILDAVYSSQREDSGAGVLRGIAACIETLSSSHLLSPPLPILTWRLSHVPLITRQPQLFSFNSDAQ